jgi:hypothetical protein
LVTATHFGRKICVSLKKAVDATRIAYRMASPAREQTR